MNKRIAVAAVVIVMMALSGLSFAADAKSPALLRPSGSEGQAPATAAARHVSPVKSNFSMIAGTISNIDASDPANVKLEVKNDVDGAMHTIFLMPWTNVTKVTDPSELKNGDTVRIMSRNMDGKESAMGVMFGKLKSLPMPRPKPVVATAPAAPQTDVKK